MIQGLVGAFQAFVQIFSDAILCPPASETDPDESSLMERLFGGLKT